MVSRSHTGTSRRIVGTSAAVIAGLVAAVFLLSGPLSGQSELADRVERVVDGDTVILARLGRTRLIGVDSPETVRPGYPVERFGRQASEFARRTLLGRNVRLEFDRERRDKHGRSLAYLYLPDGRCFDRELIRQGFAFAYTLYPFKYRLEYLRLEDEARRAGVGMWAAVPTRIRNGILHGNRRSHSYHSANCEYFNCPNCTVQFRSRYEAENQGFKPHWACIGSRQSAE
ncbi:MAG: thermonuclease family protein [Acidobacteriota bacterium]